MPFHDSNIIFVLLVNYFNLNTVAIPTLMSLKLLNLFSKRVEKHVSNRGPIKSCYYFSTSGSTPAITVPVHCAGTSSSNTGQLLPSY